MSLLEETEELKKQLAEAPEEVEEEEVEEAEEVVEEVEEQPADPVREAPPENLDDAGYARLRREKRAAERALEEERSKKKEEPEPVESTLPPEIAEMLQEHHMTKAEREFADFESEVARKNTDYEAVSKQYATVIAEGIRARHPLKSDREVSAMAKRAILEVAGEMLNKGYENPVEEMFTRAKERGYGKSQEVETKEEKVAKPNLAKVAENRKRSAGMTGASGRDEGMVSKKAAADMSPAEWKALDPADKRRLMSA